MAVRMDRTPSVIHTLVKKMLGAKQIRRNATDGLLERIK
jgi:hypothetical protein